MKLSPKMVPRLTFGLIVLNGEPFIRYWLRAVYPWAYQIIVVEGATPYASSVATPDGHSTDSTIDTIKEFQISEDPNGKVDLITAEDEGYPNGFWPGEKTEMCKTFAKRVMGNYIVTLGIDEFFIEGDYSKIYDVLSNGGPTYASTQSTSGHR